MKKAFVGTACCLVLALLPNTTPADNPSPHLSDRTASLFDPADDEEVVRILKANAAGGSYCQRDMRQLGTPIFDVFLQSPAADDRMLEALARLPLLRQVSTTHLTPHQLERIARIRQLAQLSIAEAELGMAETQALLAMPHLSTIAFSRCTFVGDDPFQTIAQARRLRSLNLVSCRGVTDDDIKELSHLVDLQTLTLYEIGVTDGALADLAGMTNLRYLDLTGTQITNAGLRKLARLSNLQELKLGFTQVGDEGVKELARVKGLLNLRLHNTEVTDAAMAELAALPTLRYLNLRETAITNAGLVKLARSNSLVNLDLRGTKVDDDGVKELARLKSLLHLTFDDTKVTDAALAELAGWPNLRSLSLCETAITSAGVAKLARAPKLTQLDLSRTKVGDEGLDALAHVTTLRYLYLHRCDALTADGVQRLKTALPQCQISGSDFKK